jgi:hypothetical protein
MTIFENEELIKRLKELKLEILVLCEKYPVYN